MSLALPRHHGDAEPKAAARLGRARRVALALALVAALTGSYAKAQTIPIGPPAPGLIETGVPEFVVKGAESLGLGSAPHDLVRLPDGRLVAVARGELAVGDGVRWEVATLRAGSAAFDGGRLAVDADGTLYAGVAGGFARVQLEGGRWSLDPVAQLPSGLASPDLVLAFIGAVDGVWFWAWTSGPIVTWRPGEEPRTVGQANAIDRVFALDGVAHYTDRSTGVLHRFERGEFQPVPGPASAYVEEGITAAVTAPGGARLCGTIGRGLVRLGADGGMTPLAQQGVLAAGRRINDLCLLECGLVAAAVDNVGVVFLDPSGRVVQVLDRTVDHRLARVQRIIAAPGGVVWALLNDGIARVRFPARVSHLGPLVPTGLAFAQPFRRDGRLWLMSDGLAQRGEYDADGRLVRFAIDSPPGYVGSLAQLGGDWLAATTDGLWLWKSAGTWVSVVAGVNSAYIRTVGSADDEYLYVARDEVGWLRRTAAGYTADRFPVDGLGHVYGAVADRHGVLWGELGTGRVVRVEPTRPRPYVEVYGTDDGIGDSWAQIFLVDGEARINTPPLVLGFDSIARRWVPDTEVIRRMPGLAGVVGRPVVDAAGRLWAPVQGGTRVGPADRVGEPESSIPAVLRPIHITPQDDGVMWLHEPTRLARYDPSVREIPDPPLRALVTRVEFAGSGRTYVMPTGKLPDVRAADNALTVHFLAPDNVPGRPVTFSVMLEGAVRADWIPTGAAGHLTFSRLDAGTYRLRVRPSAGGVAGPDAVLEFAVLAAWYRSVPAYVAYGVTVLGLLVLIGWAERRGKQRLARLVTERTGALNRANEELARQIERERAEQERRRQFEADLFQAQKLESIGTLAGGIAHDFNNILTGILGCCELAMIAARHGQPVAADLEEIRAAGLRAKDLIARILTFSRRTEARLAPHDLAAVVGEALKLLRAITPATVEIRPRLQSGRVRADATQIHQVVVNLCTNAIHAIGSSGGRVEVLVEPVSVEGELARAMPELTPGACMRLTVSDTGHGMDAATLARIFDPFFTTKAPGQGTGLGLSIVRSIVDNHGAALRVHSEPGRGTRVEIFLPCTNETESLPAADGEGGVVQGRQREIMIVDDEPAVAKFVAARLRQLDFRTQVFLDPLEARDAFAREPARYAAIVSDLTMPGISGVELIHAARQVDPQVPVVIISGYSRELAGLENGRLTRSTVLSKPFTGEDLGRALAELLDSGRNESRPG